MRKKKRHLRFKSVLLLLLFGYFLFMIGYYIYKLPVKNIYITGNSLLTDQEIINACKLKNYPSIHKYSRNKIESNIKKLDLVNKVKVKKNIFGKVSIKIEEAKPLFYYRNDDKVYLSNKKTIIDKNYTGIPILINYVPKKILEDFIDGFTLLDKDIVLQINEIEYNPDEKDGVILDDNRFILRMNDTNQVYIDSINITKLNNYQKIVAALGDNVYGFIYLNSNRTNASFKAYDLTGEELVESNEESNEN